jgi:hypothetical protein
MLESLKPRGGKRWPRGQRFALSESGVSAHAAYLTAIQDARALGRSPLEAAQASWARGLGVAPGDGVVLSELRGGQRSIAEIARALEGCGTTSVEVKQAIDRLVEAGVVEPSPGPQAVA